MSTSRQLAAIMFTDIAGYTALMGEDEQKAFELLKTNRQVQRPIIEKFNGRWLKEIGDGVLASFSTVSDAVYCATAIQKAAENHPGLELRIGLHQGEVVFEGDDVFGDGVNIASRLEPLAPPGAIYISETVFRDIQNKPDVFGEFVRQEQLKGVNHPVRIYQLTDKPATQAEPQLSSGFSYAFRKRLIVSGILIMVLFGLGYYWWNDSGSPEDSPANIKIVEIDKSIAVLPFTDISPNKDQEYFCDGMMDEILTHLYKIGDLRVVSRTSSMGYKETSKNIREIARELGVVHILEGSVRKSGDRVRITVQLIDTADKHIWAESYDRDLADVFAIQSEVAQQVAAALKAEISLDVKGRIEDLPTQNLEAYDYYLKGNEALYSSWGELTKVYESIEYYKKAIELDTSFSFAYTAMGRAYWGLAHREAKSIQPDLWELCRQYLNKAIELDPDNGWAYGELAVVLSNWDWDSTAARISLERAIELMPSHEKAYTAYMWHEFRMGNCEKFRWALEQRKRLNSWDEHPFSAGNVWWLLCQKKYAEIVSIADEHWDSDRYPSMSYMIFQAYIHENRLGRAREIGDSFNDNSSLNYWYRTSEGILSAMEGDESGAREALASLDVASRTDYVPFTGYAAVYAAMGDKERMYEYLDRALEARERDIHEINFYSVFDPYLSEPRFKDIVRDMWTPLESVARKQ